MKRLLVVLMTASCSPGGTPIPCSASNCAGCCTSTGFCEGGDAPATCGRGGVSCTQCSSGQSCALGQCVTGSGTGGGSGGTGGGSSSGLKPDVMILLDKSGSMAAPLPGGTGCGTCVFPSCNETMCPTRMGSLRTGLGVFLTEQGSVARMGLTIFPADNVCTPAGASQQLKPLTPPSDSSSDLSAWAGQINTLVQSQTVGGGTPTAASLAFVGSLSTLNDALRDDFVLLVTDGLPNCSTTNANTCVNPTACKCTLNGGQCGSTLNDSDPNNFCRRGCLDQTGAVQAVNDLRAKGIRTIVVGFGSDLSGSGDGLTVLAAMASAGGWTRRCPNGNECAAGDTCSSSTHTCGQAFYAAQNATELAAALNDVALGLSGAP